MPREEIKGKSQKELSLRIELQNQDVLLDKIRDSSVRDQARLSLLSLPHSGD